MEIGKIEGYSRYLISSEGRVFSENYNHTGQFKEMKILKYKKGYCYVKLFNDKGIAKKEKVYRLVAKAFIPNPDNKPTINHKDGDKSNNDVSNLEWATWKENVIHSFKNGLNVPIRGENHYNSKLNQYQVNDIRYLLLQKIPETKIAEKFGVSRGCISGIKTGINWRNI